MDEGTTYVLLERNLFHPIPKVALSDGYEIRQFTQGDATIWTTIQNRVFEPLKAQNFYSLYGEKFLGEGFYFAQHGLHTVGIGSGILKKTPNDTLFGVVDWVGILEEHRRKNLASALVSQALQYLKYQGLSYAYLATPAYRVNAFELYKKLGFELIARDEKERINDIQSIRAENRPRS